MRRWLPWLVAAAGLGLLVAGLVLHATGDVPDDGGAVVHEGSYEPLADSVPTTYLLTGQGATGAVCAAVGAVVLAGIGGWAVGRRTARRELQRP